MATVPTIVIVLAIAGNVFAGGGLWLGNQGNGTTWNTAASWETGVPAIGDPAYVTYNGSAATMGPVIDNSTSATASVLILGWAGWVGADGDTVTMTMTGGSLDVGSDLWIGKDDAQLGPEGPGVFNISDGSVNVGTTTGSGHLVVGQGADGTVHQTGGDVTAFRFVVDWFDADSGIYNLHGGILNITDIDAPLHLRTNALLDIMEGVMNLGGDQLGAVDGAIASGRITGFGGIGSVMRSYDSSSNSTAVWAVIPEPASILLLGISAVFILSMRLLKYDNR